MTEPAIESAEPPLRAPREIAVRLLALGAAVSRVTAESLLRSEPAGRARFQAFVDRVLQWVDRSDLATDLSPLERDLLATPLGDLNHRRVFEYSWRLQSAPALLWALGEWDFSPAFPRPVTANEIQSRFRLGEPVADYLATAALRPEADLRLERRKAEFWNWRAETEHQRRLLAAPTDFPFASIVRDGAEEAHAAGLAETSGADVLFNAKPFGELSRAEFPAVASTAQERFLACSWICGYGPGWDVSSGES